MYDGGHVREEDKAAYDRCEWTHRSVSFMMALGGMVRREEADEVVVHLIQLRLDELRRKIESTNNAANATNDTASAGIMAHE